MATRSSKKSAGATKRKTTSAPRRGSAMKATAGKVSMKQAAVAVLKAEGAPLKATVIAERVLATKGVSTNGKTPTATVQAMLAVENGKADGLFVRVEPGTYALRG